MPNKIESREEHLAHAARRASGREGFLGYFLARYGEIERLSEVELAEWLGCSIPRLHWLAFTRAPDRAERDFSEQLRQIADTAGISVLNLARVVRRVDALNRLQEAEGAVSDVLAAARDRTRDSKPGDGISGYAERRGHGTPEGDEEPKPE